MEIINYKKISKGCLLSRFDVKIDQWLMTIRNCSHLKKGDKEWIGMPSTPYDKNGMTKSYDYVSFEKSARTRFDKACLEKIRNGEYQSKDDKDTNSNQMPF